MSDYERHRPLTEAELEAEIKRFMEGESEEESVGGSDSEDDPDFVLAETDLESEQSADEGEGDDSQEDETNFSRRSKPVLRGKSDYRWTTEVPERRGRLQSKNLVVHLPGIKGKAKDATNILEFWNVLLDDEILSVIVTHTNQEIVRKTQNIANLQSYQDPTTIVEIKALIGLLYKAGVKRNSGLNVFELWSLRDGESIFRMTMPLNRFKFLISALRLDDKSTRDTRKKQDKLAAIREVWDEFIKNCTNSYTPYEYCTVDEQLMGFRGKCPFRIYMSSKPDKYGIKIVMLNDARTSYMVNAIPYCGKVDTQNEPVPSYYVRK
nr:unnamed protein product [Callosobruchus analis]